MARLTPIAQLVQDQSYDLGQNHGDPTGRTAYAVGNEPIGTVKGALAEEGGRIRYLIVDVSRWFPSKQVLVPVGLARIEDDAVSFDTLTRNQVKHLKAYEASREYTPEAQTADERVLRGTAYPGAIGMTGQDAEQRYNYRDDEDDHLFRTPDRLRLLEERLLVNKDRSTAGQVEIGKRVETHTEQVDVPLEHEELVIERHPMADPRPVEGQVTLGADTAGVRVELEAERVNVSKQAFVAEEVEIGKQTVTETQQVTGTVGHEVLETEKIGDTNLHEAAATTHSLDGSGLIDRAVDVEPAASVKTNTSVPSVPRRVIPASLLPAVALASLTAFLLRTPESRAALSNLIGTTGRRVGDTAAHAGQVVASGTRTAAHGAQQVTAAVTEAVKPLPTALTTGVASVLSAGYSTIKTLTQKEATQVNTTKAAAREALRDLQEVPRMAEVQASIQAEVGRQLDRHLGLLQQELDQQFAQQEAVLSTLGEELTRRNVESRPRRGGLPWTLLLLGGAGYVLWRQPQVRQRVTSVFQQVGPKARDTIQRAEQAVRQRLGRVQDQAAPRPAAQTEPSAVSSTRDNLAQEHRTVMPTAEDPLQPVTETQASSMSNGGETLGSPQSSQGAQGSLPAGQELGGPRLAGPSSTQGQKKPNTRR